MTNKFNFTADELNEILGFNNGKMKHSARWNRTQKIIDTLEKKGAIEGLRVIRIMTQGTCHIKLYEIR